MSTPGFSRRLSLASRIGASLLAISAASPAAATPAQDREPPTIDYILPAAAIAAQVKQRIIKCPAAASVQAEAKAGDPALDVEFAYNLPIVSKLEPQRLVRLNVGSGFLVDRDTKVQFADDWYLKQFNSTSTGQGGALVVSLIKAGAVAYGLAANPLAGAAAVAGGVAGAGLKAQAGRPPRTKSLTRYYLVCKDEVVRALARLAAKEADIAALEARIVDGAGGTAVQALLAQRRAEASDIEDALTIATDKVALRPKQSGPDAYSDVAVQIKAAPIEDWFEVDRHTIQVSIDDKRVNQAKPVVRELLLGDQDLIPGLHGYQLLVSVDRKLAPFFGCGSGAEAPACVSAIADTAPIATRHLVYRRPVPATVVVYPLKTPCTDTTPCPRAERWDAADQASASANVKLPQLSRLHVLRTSGSIFGSRTIAAEFGSGGEPTMLQYAVGSAGKDAAGIVDAVAAGAESIDDARLNATKDRLERLKARKELEDFLDENDGH